MTFVLSWTRTHPLIQQSIHPSSCRMTVFPIIKIPLCLCAFVVKLQFYRNSSATFTVRSSRREIAASLGAITPALFSRLKMPDLIRSRSWIPACMHSGFRHFRPATELQWWTNKTEFPDASSVFQDHALPAAGVHAEAPMLKPVRARQIVPFEVRFW